MVQWTNLIGTHSPYSLHASIHMLLQCGFKFTSNWHFLTVIHIIKQETVFFRTSNAPIHKTPFHIGTRLHYSSVQFHNQMIIAPTPWNQTCPPNAMNCKNWISANSREDLNSPKRLERIGYPTSVRAFLLMGRHLQFPGRLQSSAQIRIPVTDH